MILKLIMLGIAFVAIYRFMGGSFSLGSPKNSNNNDIDALEECSNCGLLITKQESIRHNNKIYCSEKCIPR